MRCAECDATIPERQATATYCSERCRQRRKKREQYRRKHPGLTPRGPIQPRMCTTPGCDGKPLAHGLCQRHYRAARRAEGTPWALTGGDARRRARRHGAAYEPILHAEVFTRDAWTCGICRTPVDPTLKHPHPMSASLDHIVPLARGGDHLRTNVQCAHLACNLAKRDTLPTKG